MNPAMHLEMRVWLTPFLTSEETCTEAVDRREKLGPGEKRPLILVADDESLIRQTIVEILRAEGFDAVGVKDGIEAIECARRLKPSVFLADVYMPRLNGIEAAKAIRDLLPKTRVICFSGHASTSGLIQQAREEGEEFEFLPKPIRPEILVRTINRAQD